jgi:hypothetical protein
MGVKFLGLRFVIVFSGMVLKTLSTNGLIGMGQFFPQAVERFFFWSTLQNTFLLRASTMESAIQEEAKKQDEILVEMTGQLDSLKHSAEGMKFALLTSTETVMWFGFEKRKKPFSSKKKSIDPSL